MPNPNESNPLCQHCGYFPTKKQKTLVSGLTRYQCKVCGKYTTPGAKHGGHNKIDDGLTPQQRWNRANQDKLTDLQRERRKKDQNDD
jgi:hypothetical protein